MSSSRLAIDFDCSLVTLCIIYVCFVLSCCIYLYQIVVTLQDCNNQANPCRKIVAKKQINKISVHLGQWFSTIFGPQTIFFKQIPSVRWTTFLS